MHIPHSIQAAWSAFSFYIRNDVPDVPMFPRLEAKGWPLMMAQQAHSDKMAKQAIKQRSETAKQNSKVAKAVTAILL